MTLGQALQAVPPQGPLQLPEGSWGEGGDHRVWLNRDTEWTWDRVYSAERGVGRAPADRATAVSAELKRVLAQASRELMLLQASDWQFLITTGAARDYAERRVAEHYAEFKRLSEMAHTLRQRPAAVHRSRRDPAPAGARGLRLPRSRSVLGQPPMTGERSRPYLTGHLRASRSRGTRYHDAQAPRARARDDHGRR